MWPCHKNTNFKTYWALMIRGSIQRTQTPPRMLSLTLWCDLDLSSRSIKLMSLDVAYCIVLWYQTGMMSMGYLLYEIPSIVYFIWHFTFTCDLQLLSRPLTLHYMYFMLLNVCNKNEVCSSSRIWNMNICMKKT